MRPEPRVLPTGLHPNAQTLFHMGHGVGQTFARNCNMIQAEHAFSPRLKLTAATIAPGLRHSIALARDLGQKSHQSRDLIHTQENLGHLFNPSNRILDESPANPLNVRPVPTPRIRTVAIRAMDDIQIPPGFNTRSLRPNMIRPSDGPRKDTKSHKPSI
jgi:hypothetical protein